MTVSETECRIAPVGFRPSDRVSPGPGVGPVSRSGSKTALNDALAQLAQTPAPPDRNYEVVVDTGVLTCAGCGAFWSGLSSRGSSPF